MLNTHPINRLSKAGAALVNTISSYACNYLHLCRGVVGVVLQFLEKKCHAS